MTTSPERPRRICSICARGGSKGVPDKNIRIVAGKPLIVHTIVQAQQSGLFDALAVSSDSREILAVAANAGIPYLIERPPHLASDHAAKIPAIRHCVAEVERRSGTTFAICVDLDCTSPLRSVADIEAAVRLFEAGTASNLFSVAPARHSPYFNMVELEARGVPRLSKALTAPVVRRQDAPRTYDINGSIYIWRRAALAGHDTLFLDDTMIYEMPRSRSFDIDDDLDLRIVSHLLAPVAG